MRRGVCCTCAWHLNLLTTSLSLSISATLVQVIDATDANPAFKVFLEDPTMPTQKKVRGARGSCKQNTSSRARTWGDISVGQHQQGLQWAVTRS
jgi:hypothetical protein